MKMHVLSGGRLQMKKRIYLPDADREALIDLPVSSFLLRHPQGNVLFDTGCHPTVATDAEERWGGLAKVMRPVFEPNENVIDQLKLLDIAAEDIDLVINSHFHSDHCGCNEFFRKSTVLCHQHELETANGPGAEQKGFLAVDWKQPMPIDTVDNEHDVFGDGRIVLVPLPGHTPGSMGALVGLDRSGTFLLAADAAPLATNLEREIIPRNTMDADAATRSMDEIRRLQTKGATVLHGHDQEQWEQLKKGADAYE